MKYQKKLRALLNNNLQDIIIFGSSVKGGFAKDIDVALITKWQIDVTDIKRRIRNILEKETDIQVIDVNSIYSSIWLTLIKEGYSIKKKKFLAEIYKIKPTVLYKYSLKKLSNVQKVQFERGIKNTIGKDGAFLTRSVVMVPIGMKNEMMEFLKRWNIYYESREYELLPVMRKEEFL